MARGTRYVRTMYSMQTAIPMFMATKPGATTTHCCDEMPSKLSIRVILPRLLGQRGVDWMKSCNECGFITDSPDCPACGPSGLAGLLTFLRLAYGVKE